MKRKDTAKSQILFDIDGFFSPANMSSNHKLVSVDLEPQPFEILFELYYLGLRSSMFICEDTIKNEEKAYEAIRTWREECVKIAMSYATSHSNLGKVLAPDFMWIMQTALVDELQDIYPDVKNTQLRISMRPKLSASVVDKDIITFPALARTVLNHYNLVLTNSILKDINKEGQILNEPDMRNTTRFILPYLLFCHDDFSVQNLPIIGAHSAEAFNMAMALTYIQLLFILAHESAHIQLKHFMKRKVDLEDKLLLENEADIFALNVVLEHGEKKKLYSRNDVFTAIRWLFKYQLLEESVGILMRGNKLEFSSSKFEQRRGEFQSELINKYSLRGSTLFETRGFYILVELQSILYNFGDEFINDIVIKFKESQKTKVIEPWWEKIMNK